MTDSPPTSSSTSSSLSIYDEGPSCRGATQVASSSGGGGGGGGGEDNSAGPSVTARRSREGEHGTNGQQTWSEFLLGGQAERGEIERESPTVNAAASDASSVAGRKRRLTGAAEHDAASHERGQSRTRQAQPSSMSPSTPAPVRQVSWRSDNSWVPGSSRETAIDVSGSPHSVSRQMNSLRHRESSFTDHWLPRWQPDSEVSKCPICGTTFSFFYRKHHCRKCGRVVCASCSPHRITIPLQFIVRPPEAQRTLSSIVQPNPSATQVINLIDDDDNDSRNRSQRQRYRPPSNPGLGGGEEVRLCNPCVPDPNPEPPRRYGAIDNLARDTGSSWGPETPRGANNRYASFRQNSHRSSASVGSHPFHANASELRRTGRTGARGESFPHPSGAFDYLPGFPGFPPSYSSSESRGRHRHFSPPIYGSSTGSRQRDYPSSREYAIGHRTHSHGNNHGANLSSGRTRPLAHPPMGERYQSVNEQDVCPVCNLVLPPRAANGNEEAREAHIRSCIERLGAQSQTGSRPGHASPDLPVGMLHFVATEKDCVGREGTAQECSICMEEYEVGSQLTRLECLCKFHKLCIIDWFRRKQECPVHKVA